MHHENACKMYSETQEGLVSHFLLSEFENRCGWVIVSPHLIRALELTRAGLCAIEQEEVQILITDCTRTPEQLRQLGARLGWVDQGGVVARHSYHLIEFGGIAADFKARRKRDGHPLSAFRVAEVANLYFDYVNHYDDGHVHGDHRRLVTG